MKRKDFMKNSILLLGLGFLIPFYKHKPKKELKKLPSFSSPGKGYKLIKRLDKPGMPDVYEEYLSRKNSKIEIERNIFKSKKNVEKLRPHLVKFIKGYYEEGKLQKMKIKEIIIDQERIDITKSGDTWFMSEGGERRFTIIVGK